MPKGKIEERSAPLSIDCNASVSYRHARASATAVHVRVVEAEAAVAPSPRTNAEDDDDYDKKPPAKCDTATSKEATRLRLQLPREVVGIVLLYVDIGDIPVVAVVSKDWTAALKHKQDDHFLYLLRRHKNILSRFSDKVLIVDGIGSVVGGLHVEDGSVVAAAVDNTSSINNNSVGSVGEGGEGGDDPTSVEMLKPSPRWKILFRRALFIMRLAHNPRMRLNMLDGPDNRTTLPEPRSDSSYFFDVNVHVQANDRDVFRMVPSSVSGSNIDSDGSLLVEIPRNDLYPVPTSKLAKGFIWMRLRHQSGSSHVVFRGRYTPLNGLRLKKRHTWKDMELPNGDLVVMGRKISLSTRNHVDAIGRSGKINIRFRFDMESLAVGNNAGKELFQDLSRFEILRVLESLMFVNGPRVASTPAAGRSLDSRNSHLPPSFGNGAIINKALHFCEMIKDRCLLCGNENCYPRSCPKLVGTCWKCADNHSMRDCRSNTQKMRAICFSCNTAIHFGCLFCHLVCSKDQMHKHSGAKCKNSLVALRRETIFLYGYSSASEDGARPANFGDYLVEHFSSEDACTTEFVRIVEHAQSQLQARPRS